jgi:hypothetical protein
VFPFPPCGLLACLDFGPCPLVSFKSKKQQMQIFFSQANLKAIHLKPVTNFKLDDLKSKKIKYKLGSYQVGR